MRVLVVALVSAAVVAGCADPSAVPIAADPSSPSPSSPSPSSSPPSVPPPTTAAASSDAPGPTVSTSTAALPDPSAPTGWGPTVGELAKARRIVSSMSLRAKARQVLMPTYRGRRDLARHQYGGVYLPSQLLAGGAGHARRVVRGAHRVADRPGGIPLLIALDQEGGVVQHLRRGVARVPSARSVGATGSTRYARRVARRNGRQLRDLRFTMVLAPVADVDTAGNPIVGSRAYSRRHRKAAEMVTATVRGYLDAGIVPVVKHFPGHGSVVGDSHERLPVQHKSVRRLMRTDLRPFRAAIDAGAPAIMTGHIAVRSVAPGVPASLSRKVVMGLLRDRLGFDGLVVTDAHTMQPVRGPYGSGRAAVLAIAAGNDLVLSSPDVDRAHGALVRAVRSGRLSRDRLAAAATRVIAVRLMQERIGRR